MKEITDKEIQEYEGCDGCSTGDCPHQNVNDCVKAQGQTIAAQAAEIQKLQDAIKQAGFGVMKTSGDWLICDVSKKGEADQARTDEVIRQNIDLELKLKEANDLLLDILKVSEPTFRQDVRKIRDMVQLHINKLAAEPPAAKPDNVPTSPDPRVERLQEFISWAATPDETQPTTPKHHDSAKVFEAACKLLSGEPVRRKSRVKVSVLRRHQAFVKWVNSLDFDNIEWTDFADHPITIPPATRDEFKTTGFNNSTFSELYIDDKEKVVSSLNNPEESA